MFLSYLSRDYTDILYRFTPIIFSLRVRRFEMLKIILDRGTISAATRT